jgi:hypothetical protein
LASLSNRRRLLSGTRLAGLDFVQTLVTLWEVLMDPNPDYDASDEIEYFFQWLPWGLRGVYPPPAYPPV